VVGILRHTIPNGETPCKERETVLGISLGIGLNMGKAEGGTAMKINPGDVVTVITADGQHLPRRAASEILSGYDFPVVMVCTEEEWAAAAEDRRDPDTLAWPVTAIEEAAGVS
jgi:hypothetical protein